MLGKRFISLLLSVMVMLNLSVMIEGFAVGNTITWEDISNDQLKSNVTENLNLMTAIGENSVTWTSSKPNSVATNGVVTRLANDEAVTLVGTVNGQSTYTFNIVVSSYKEGNTKWVDDSLATATLKYRESQFATATSNERTADNLPNSPAIWKYDAQNDRLYTDPQFGVWYYDYDLKIGEHTYSWDKNSSKFKIDGTLQSDTPKSVQFTYSGTTWTFYYVDEALTDSEGKAYRVGVCVNGSTVRGWTSFYVNIENDVLSVDTSLTLDRAISGYMKPNLEPVLSNETIKLAHLELDKSGMKFTKVANQTDGYRRFSFRFRHTADSEFQTTPNFLFTYNGYMYQVTNSNGVARQLYHYYNAAKAYYTTSFNSSESVEIATSNGGKLGSATEALGIKTTADGLSNIPSVNKTTFYAWTEIMMMTDVAKKHTVMYYNGQPVYWNVTANGTTYYTPYLVYDNNNKADYNGFGWPNDSRLKVNYEVDSVRWEEITAAEIAAEEFRREVGSGVDIGDIDGLVKYFEQDFDELENVRVTSDMGFSAITDTKDNANVNYFVEYNEIGREEETNNKVARAVPKKSMARADAQLYASLSQSSDTVKWGSTTYKVKDFVDGYYIASTCTSTANALYWFKKDSIQDGSLKSSPVMNTDYGQWFEIDEDLKPYNIAAGSGTSFSVPAPGSDAVKYAVQFDFAYPSNGNIWTALEALQINVDGNQFHMRNSGIVRSGDGSGTKNLCFGDLGNSKEDTSEKVLMVPAKTLDLPYYFDKDTYAANLLKLSSLYTDGEWNKVMVYFDLEERYFTIYINGLPMYAKAENGGYSCRWYLDNNSPAALEVVTDRYLVYNDHAPVFDNFLGYSAAGTDEDLAQAYVNGLRIPYIDDFDIITGDILFDERESEGITWSFDKDTFVIDANNPLIARYNAPYGFGTSTVKLTASYTYGTATAKRDFELTVKDKPYFSIDSVVMKDAEGNRIYRPLDGSKIEDVVCTVNSEDVADVYLALYDSENRMTAAEIGEVSNGTVEFGKSIDEDTKYKVFAWKKDTLSPLSLVKSDDFSENATPKVFVLGDSIAATYTSERSYGGWGQYLDSIFSDSVSVDNSQSMGGRSMKYVLDEYRFGYIMDRAKPGDYMFIMLGCNDEVPPGTTPSKWYKATQEEYKMLLKAMCKEAKRKGIVPVVLTTVARYSWIDEEKDANTGLYHPKDTYATYGYPAIALEAALETGSVSIDMNKIVLDELAKLGPDATAAYYADETHTTKEGAQWVVGLLKNELSKMNTPLSDFLIK